MGCAATVTLKKAKSGTSVIMSRAEQLAGSGSDASFRTPEHQMRQTEKNGSTVFSLFHVLKNQVPFLFERHEEATPKKRRELILQDLTQLLYADYASFLKEELGFSLYANVLDVNFHGDHISANDVRYADSGLADQCARAVRQALQDGDLERAARYRLEEEQTLLLLTRAENEFQILRNALPHVFLNLASQLEDRANLPVGNWQRAAESELPQTLKDRLR